MKVKIIHEGHEKKTEAAMPIRTFEISKLLEQEIDAPGIRTVEFSRSQETLEEVREIPAGFIPKPNMQSLVKDGVVYVFMKDRAIGRMAKKTKI